jgi:hypothetical protein
MSFLRHINRKNGPSRVAMQWCKKCGSLHFGNHTHNRAPDEVVLADFTEDNRLVFRTRGELEDVFKRLPNWGMQKP